MKIAILGSGGREHAMAYSISKSEKIKKIYCLPGNAGTSELGENVDIDINNFEEIYNFLKINGISQEINDVHTLSSNITKDLYEDKKIDNTSIEKINAYGDNILNKTVLEINELITK